MCSVVKDYLALIDIVTFSEPLYSPDLALVEFILICRGNTDLGVYRHRTAAEVKMASMLCLTNIPEKDFLCNFQKGKIVGRSMSTHQGPIWKIFNCLYCYLQYISSRIWPYYFYTNTVSIKSCLKLRFNLEIFQLFIRIGRGNKKRCFLYFSYYNPDPFRYLQYS